MLFFIMLISLNSTLRPLCDALADKDLGEVLRNVEFETFDTIVKQTRLIGTFFLTADYSKYALGFF